MQNVNWWLMALAFALGLVLTLALMIRRVKREVPEYATLAAGASAAGAGAAAAGAAGAAKLSGGSAAAVEDEPYGAGSVRVAATATAPDGGYTIKGNEDSMLYHTPDSPSYRRRSPRCGSATWRPPRRRALHAGTAASRSVDRGSS